MVCMCTLLLLLSCYLSHAEIVRNALGPRLGDRLRSAIPGQLGQFLDRKSHLQRSYLWMITFTFKALRVFSFHLLIDGFVRAPRSSLRPSRIHGSFFSAYPYHHHRRNVSPPLGGPRRRIVTYGGSEYGLSPSPSSAEFMAFSSLSNPTSRMQRTSLAPSRSNNRARECCWIRSRWHILLLSFLQSRPCAHILYAITFFNFRSVTSV